MNEALNIETCARGADVIAYLYGELDEREILSMKQHLQACAICNSDIESLGQIRNSIGAWKQQTLAHAFSGAAVSPAMTKTAWGALKHFFELSPMWLKGAVAFASLLFCMMGALTVYRLSDTGQIAPVAYSNAIYTEEQMQLAVRKALDARTAVTTRDNTGETAVVAKPANKSSIHVERRSQLARNRRPLSISERQELAADLRLLIPTEELTFDLVGDRINR